MENEQKIKDSKGNIYHSCPYIDEIISTLDEQLSFYNNIKSNLEIIRKINQELRSSSDKYEIVNDLLGIDVEDLRWVKHNTQDIVHKLKRLENLEKENEELKQEINNLTNKN